MRRSLPSLILIAILSGSLLGADQPTIPRKIESTKIQKRVPAASLTPRVCSRCIRAHMDFLASDALRGRGSATPDEQVAAAYIATELMQYGIQPAGDHGGYVQKVPLIRRKFSIPPQLRFTAPSISGSGEDITWKHGLEMLVLHVGRDELSGPLQKIDLSATPQPAAQIGALVFLTGSTGKVPGRGDAEQFLKAGAAAVLIPTSPGYRAHWQAIGERLYSHTLEVADKNGNPEDQSTLIMLNREATSRLAVVPDGTILKLVAPEEASEPGSTWNVVGKIEGRSPALKNSVILLTAHLDHLGIGRPVNGDEIYNGADDDASGTTAVLEAARVFGAGRRPRRTVIFALFGSEELGDLGSTYFLDHAPVPLTSIAANLEFEMIGRADSTVAQDTLWLTGWERTNLGPTLAAHGAKLVADPHPDENFFSRSDNYALALRGVVAQTVSSFGLHADYHRPSDDLAHIDFKHMDDAIGSMLRPIEWLANSSFRPAWNKGEEP
jgi:aminopeptidase YwaD